MVHNREDSIFAVPRWESHDQVHGYLLEWVCVRRDCDAIERGFLWMGDDFILLAGSASSDVIRNPVVHFGPLVNLFGFSNGFISTRVSRCHVIVSICHDRAKEFIG